MTQDSLFGQPSAPAQLDEVVVFCDGGSHGNPGPSAIGTVVLDPSSDPPRRLAAVSERIGVTTNNVAEYRALIAGLVAAEPFGARCIRVRADSLLVIEQVKGTWKVKQPHLRPLLAEKRALLVRYAEVDLQHVSRAENTDADALVNAALDAAPPGSDLRVLLWFVFGAIFGVWNVFQSPGLDFRLVAVGALLPTVLDLPFGAQAYAHTLLAATVVLVVTMLATTGHGDRLRRRRALGLAIGWFSALVLSAAWTHKEVFWWPAFGATRPSAALFPVWPVLVVEELLGVAAAWWAWSRFGLRNASRRRALLRTGRLTIVGEGE